MISKRKRFIQHPVPPNESTLLVLLGMVIGTEMIAVPLLVAAVILLNLDPSRIFQFAILMHVIGAIGGALWIRFWPPVFFRRLKKVPAIVVGQYGNPAVLPVDPDSNGNDLTNRHSSRTPSIRC